MISHVPHLSMSGILKTYNYGTADNGGKMRIRIRANADTNAEMASRGVGMGMISGEVGGTRSNYVMNGSVIDTVDDNEHTDTIDSADLEYDSNEEDMITTYMSGRGRYGMRGCDEVDDGGDGGYGEDGGDNKVLINKLCVNVHDVIHSLNKNIYEFGMVLDTYIRRHELILSNDSIIPMGIIREFKGSRHSRRLKVFIQSLRNKMNEEGGREIIEKWNDYTLIMMVNASMSNDNDNDAELTHSIAQFRAYHGDILADWSYITTEMIEAIRKYTTTGDKEAIAEVFRNIVVSEYVRRTKPLRNDMSKNIPVIMDMMSSLFGECHVSSKIVNCYEDKYNILYKITTPEWRHMRYDVSNISITVRQLETDWLECETVEFKYNDICYIIKWVYEETYMTQETMENEYMDTLNGIPQKYVERYYMKLRYTKTEDVIEKLLVWWRAVFKELETGRE